MRRLQLSRSKLQQASRTSVRALCARVCVFVGVWVYACEHLCVVCMCGERQKLFFFLRISPSHTNTHTLSLSIQTIIHHVTFSLSLFSVSRLLERWLRLN